MVLNIVPISLCMFWMGPIHMLSLPIINVGDRQVRVRKLFQVKVTVLNIVPISLRMFRVRPIHVLSLSCDN